MQKGNVFQKLRLKEAILTEPGTWGLVAMAKRETSGAVERPSLHKGKESRSPGRWNLAEEEIPYRSPGKEHDSIILTLLKNRSTIRGQT